MAWHIELGFDAHDLVDENGKMMMTSYSPLFRYANLIIAAQKLIEGLPEVMDNDTKACDLLKRAITSSLERINVQP